MMSRVPPVSIAAIGMPSALASISTRLSDSGPREGKINIDAAASSRVASSLSTQPVNSICRPDAFAARSSAGAIGTVTRNHQRPVEIRLLDDLDEIARALVGRQLPEVQRVGLRRA